MEQEEGSTIEKCDRGNYSVELVESSASKYLFLAMNRSSIKEDPNLERQLRFELKWGSYIGSNAKDVAKMLTTPVRT